MATWSELEAAFRELSAPLRFHRIDYQWGAAGEYWHLAGGPHTADAARFEILAAIAGAKLTEVPPETLQQEVWAAPTPAERWYQAVRYHSGQFGHLDMAWQLDEKGKEAGTLFSGSVQQPADASALVCLQLTTVSPRQQTQPAAQASLNSWLAREAERRGYLWLVLGFIVMAVLAYLAIAAVPPN